jgi:hypothetical protein
VTVPAIEGNAMGDTDDLFTGVPQSKPLSLVKQRLLRSAVEIEADDPDSILYQHTVLCQTSLPYRDPGDDVREWERKQGSVALKVSAGEVRSHDTDQWVRLGLPYGPKPRLILAHLNAEALRTGSPEIEVGATLTAFVRRLFGDRVTGRRDPNGREIQLFKNQLGRLAAAMVRLSDVHDGRAYQVDTKVVAAFDLWLGMHGEQRVLWPSIVRLSLDYFESLTRHAVPLDERAVATLSHNAMALDVYAWQAQRLHRVTPGKPAFIPWTALRDQFGQGYGRMDNFKRVFLHTLRLVHTQYSAARIDLDQRGMTLHHSPPAVKGRVYLIPKS